MLPVDKEMDLLPVTNKGHFHYSSLGKETLDTKCVNSYSTVVTIYMHVRIHKAATSFCKIK